MKKVLAKIWVPLLLTAIAATQSFGIDAGRAAGLGRLADSLIFNQLPDTTTLRDSAARTHLRDSLIASGDSLGAARLDSLYIQDSPGMPRFQEESARRKMQSLLFPDSLPLQTAR